mmetsp:Transcript_43126/g.131378  ORF Transcript_43126/g.131378 Transcript_43126/m.131378 type:complete len:86 (-) Transcript_43126:1166-1423(-)
MRRQVKLNAVNQAAHKHGMDAELDGTDAALDGTNGVSESSESEQRFFTFLAPTKRLRANIAHKAAANAYPRIVGSSLSISGSGTV